MFRVGDFSRLSNISIRMLRHYDKIGLLTPESVDEFTGYRSYSAKQLSDANKIQRLKSLGFSLASIGEMISGRANVEQFYSIRKSELEEEMDRIRIQSDLLNQAIAIMKEGEKQMEYNVVIKEIPERNVMSLRKIISSYEEEGILWQELFEAFQTLRVQPGEPMMGVSIYHDKEFKEHDVDVEVQSTVKGSYPDTEEVK